MTKTILSDIQFREFNLTKTILSDIQFREFNLMYLFLTLEH